MRPILILLLFLTAPTALFAGYSHLSGKWSPEQFAPSASVQEHYDWGFQALQREDWDQAIINFMTIVYHFPDSPFYNDAIFYSGVGYYHRNHFDIADRQFNRYLEQRGKLKHFQRVFEYKYQIAEYYRKGRRKHLFGFEHLPRWILARGDAIELYDEIAAALPAQEVAAQALYSKGKLLRKKKQYRESIEALKTVTRRFPKHELAADSFLLIAKVYRDQCQLESQNPDLIALAQVNLQKFRKNFPGDVRLEEARESIVAMQEFYAESLYETGRYYERKKKPHASAIYYNDTIHKYPESEAAQKSQDRLIVLGQPSPELPLIAEK